MRQLQIVLQVLRRERWYLRMTKRRVKKRINRLCNFSKTKPSGGVAKNIQHSLKCYQYGGHFRALYDLYEKNELTSAINRVVEDVNHRFTLDVLTKDFMSHDLGISARNLRNDRQNSNDILDRIDKEEFTKRLKNLLEIRNKEEQIVTISEDHRR